MLPDVGMGVSHIAVIAAISLSGLLPFSCSKSSTSTTAKQHAPIPTPVVTNSKPVVSTPSNAKDLGELELTNRFETCINLGAGRSCTITPKLLDHDSVQLTMALQSRQANGKTAGLIITQVTTRPGKPFEVAVGDMDIILTPEIVQE
ncbi:MAG: hypothetical protein ABSD57_13345 [Verrucomicrobiota bacterium]|jgi:hypothetical protein